MYFHISFPLSEVINGFITAFHNDNPEEEKNAIHLKHQRCHNINIFSYQFVFHIVVFF